MQYDRNITISAGAGRRATHWTTQTLLVSELWERLKVPARGTETLAEYWLMNPVNTANCQLLFRNFRAMTFRLKMR